MSATESHRFKADESKILQLVIKSLYSHREIFLRELISNASDALEKRRYRELTEHDGASATEATEIRITTDSEAGTLSIEDFGVGMTRDELIENLGTVARSGTGEFLKAIENSQAEGSDQLIGQFGVGFYSAYLVADRVDVLTRSMVSEGDAWLWSSEADETFTLEAAERAEAGTRITLHLKEDAREFLSEWSLRDLVRKYSDYVSHPIMLEVERPGEGEDAEPVVSFEQVNKASAIWQRSKADVSDADYEEFYKHIGHDFEAPLAHSHFKVEGTQLFTGLLFVPGRAPFDLYMANKRRGVRLYVKRVFIMDDCEELVPNWLRFLRGVIDSDDLPLNVSRELLQDSTTVRFIQKQVIRKSLAMFGDLAKESEEKDTTFWEAFGAVIKEGLHAATDGSRKKLALWERPEARS